MRLAKLFIYFLCFVLALGWNDAVGQVKPGTVKPDNLPGGGQNSCHINGPTSVNGGSQQGYSLTCSAQATSYYMDVTGGTIVGNNGSSTISEGVIYTILWDNDGRTGGSIYAGAFNSASTTVGITITPIPVYAGTASGTQSINPNTIAAALSCTAATGGTCGGSYVYQWQQSTDNVNFSNISGATGLTYSPGVVSANTYYRVCVTCGSLTAYSNTVMITVYPPLQIGTVSPATQTFNYNTAPAGLSLSTVTGGNGVYTYQWQQSSDNVNFTNVSGATGSTYSPGALTATTYYRVYVTAGTQTGYSNTVTATMVYPGVQTGTISPSSQTINYNTASAVLSLPSVSGGNGMYTYQWLASYTVNGVYSPVGSGGSTYSPGQLTTTTYYEVKVTSINGMTATSAPAVINVNPRVIPAAINPGALTIASGTNPGPLVASPASGGACNGAYGYQWQSSTDNINWSSIPGVTGLNYSPGILSSTTYYRIQTTCGTDVEYSPVATITIGSVNSGQNYIRERTFSLSGITDTVTADGLTSPTDVQQVTQYLDGLGRRIQTVAKQSSPLQNDMVAMNVYDSLGRQSTQYLPYTSPSNDGNYKANFMAEQNAFYTGQFPNESFFYSQAVFESSPLNRVQKTFAPGVSWAGSEGSGAEKSVQRQYLLNTLADSVRLWTIAFPIGSIPVTSGTYGAGQLGKTVGVDEAGHQVVSYKNMLGQTILKKVQLSGTPTTGHAGWLCTYYVYDDLGNLRFVLQPRAVELINGSWSISAGVAAELCFRYEYDARHRPIIRKVPGAGETDLVYDARDRVVMMQDSLLRAQGKWMVSEYDVENRPWRSGLLTDPNNRVYHQNLASSSTSYPNTSSNYEVLSEAFFDNYSWVAGTGTALGAALDNSNIANSSYFITGYNTSPTYAVAIAQDIQTRGMVTGSMVKVVGTTSQYLYKVSFYDNRGRTIQEQSINATGGKDEVTIQYDFRGKMLRTYLQHQKAGTNAQTHTISTKMSYDAAGRILAITKNIDAATSDQTIGTYTYNELGQLQNKALGNSIENLAYAYTIRGWLSSINKNYISGSSNSNYFGMELAYDKTASANTSTSYLSAQFNGNITGTMWKSRGDGIGRKYDFAYDTVGRLTAAKFLQNTSGSSWDNSTVDFTANNMSYDANGNLLTMNQKGYKVGGSSLIDSLSYSYMNGNTSNKLMGVVDAANDTTAKLGDFQYNPAAKQSSDYTYDGNGNIVTDNNRVIDNTVYNFLNLPQLIHIKGKGNIQYVYDASGSKLQKITTDSAAGKITTTSYVGAFVYQNHTTLTGGAGTDTLQFVSMEEGRIRWAFHVYTTGTTAYKWEYDYFLRDNQGNTRMVLTQQKDTTQYMATMEAAYRNTENQLFYNIPATSYPRASISGYPNDATTNPNDSVARVNGSGQKVGPAIILKVMSGDSVDVAVKSYYASQTGTGTSPSIMNALSTLATGLVNMTAGAKGALPQLNTTSSPLYNALNTFVNTNDPSPTGQPKAYLNWMLLDNQFNIVNTYPQSGAIPVGNFAAGTLGTPGLSNIPITKNGYLYIWVSNETQGWDVFFDNLSVRQRSGPLLEENHYYPYGLTMAGISDKAVKTNYAENKNRYNEGSELQNKEFSDGSGLEMYDAAARGYDQQIGRFHQIDPLADKDIAMSCYAYGGSNPVLYNDPTGMHRPPPQAEPTGVWANAGSPFGAPGGGGGGGGCAACLGPGMTMAMSDNGVPLADQVWAQSVANAESSAQAAADGNPGSINDDVQPVMANLPSNGGAILTPDGEGDGGFNVKYINNVSVSFGSKNGTQGAWLDYGYGIDDGSGITLGSDVFVHSFIGGDFTDNSDGGNISPRSFHFRDQWPGSRAMEAGVSDLYLEVSIAVMPGLPPYVKRFEFTPIYVQFPRLTWTNKKYGEAFAAVTTAEGMQLGITATILELQSLPGEEIANMSDNYLQRIFMRNTAFMISSLIFPSGATVLNRPVGKNTVVGPAIWGP